MRCVIAKVNPVLMNLAAKHYLGFYTAKGNPKPTLFTFKSLYSDEEPYPLEELIFCIGEQLALLDKQFKEQPSEVIAIEHSLLKRKQYRLMKLQERTRGKIEEAETQI